MSFRRRKRTKIVVINMEVQGRGWYNNLAYMIAMGESFMADIQELRQYYVDNLKEKIFLEEKTINGKRYSILYIHNIWDEESSFVETFTRYFPYYVWNEDQIQYIDINNSADLNLEKASQKCWDSEVVPRRETKANGIYGEVLLDFYERIVHDRRLIATYASRRAFNSNAEAKGYDHIGYIINNGQLEVVLGEAKYVTNVSSAKTALVEDIEGKYNGNGTWVQGHLTKEYFDSFLNFIIQKRDVFSEVEKEEISDLMKELNRELVMGNGEFLRYIIEHNMRVNCIFFAVFQNAATKPEKLEKYYDKIYAKAIQALDCMNVTNYSIEIVFIPTDATSMQIKEKIDEFYR